MKTIVALVLAGAALGFSTAAFAQANPNGIDPEHYQCYRPGLTEFQPREVRLRDQFGTATVKVVRVAFLCAPVSKNGGLLADKESHLVCYTEENGQKADKRVRTINQFGRLEFDLGNAVMLCVPSLKRVLPPPPG
jgi:hypothetical protein